MHIGPTPDSNSTPSPRPFVGTAASTIARDSAPNKAPNTAHSDSETENTFISKTLLGEWGLKINTPFNGSVVERELDTSKQVFRLLLALNTPNNPKTSEFSLQPLQVISDINHPLNSQITLLINQQKQLQVISNGLVANTDPQPIPKKQLIFHALSQIELSNLNQGLNSNTQYINKLLTMLAATKNTHSFNIGLATEGLKQVLTEFPQVSQKPVDASTIKSWIESMISSGSSSGQNPNVNLPEGLISSLKELYYLFSRSSKESAITKKVSDTTITSSEMAIIKANDIKIKLINENIGQLLQVLSKQIIDQINLQRLHNQLQLSESFNKATHHSDTSLQTDLKQSFYVEIPIRHGEQAAFIRTWIDKQPSEEKNKSPCSNKTMKLWKVRLDFNLPNLGLVQAEATLIKERVKISLWAEHPTTKEIIEQQLNHLSDRLVAKGLDIEELNCHCGNLPPATSIHSAYKTDKYLLDTRG